MLDAWIRRHIDTLLDHLERRLAAAGLHAN